MEKSALKQGLLFILLTLTIKQTVLARTEPMIFATGLWPPFTIVEGEQVSGINTHSTLTMALAISVRICCCFTSSIFDANLSCI